MSRNNKPSFVDEKFTLFPFLDALSGVVGVLALIICSLSLLATDMPMLVFDMPVNKTEKSPRYVECIDEAIVIHPEKKMISIEQMKSNEGPWHDFLNRVKKNRNHEYAVLLLRMDGLESYDIAMKAIQKAGLDVGREIVQMDGEIEINLGKTK